MKIKVFSLYRFPPLSKLVSRGFWASITTPEGVWKPSQKLYERIIHSERTKHSTGENGPLEAICPIKPWGLSSQLCQFAGGHGWIFFRMPWSATRIATFLDQGYHMGVSKNRGTPKSSILRGFSIINHSSWGTPIFGNIHMISLHLLHPGCFGRCPSLQRWHVVSGGWNASKTEDG